MSSRTALLAAALVAGCAGSSARAPVPVVPVAAAIVLDALSWSAPAPEPPLLVWTEPPSGPLETHWLAPTLTGHTVVATAEGALIPVDGAVYRWRTVEVPVATHPCDGEQRAAVDGGGAEGVATRAWLERAAKATSAHSISVAEPTNEAAAQIEHGVELLGSLGSLLFVRESATTYSCGAHGGTSASFFVLDARTQIRRDRLEGDAPMALDAEQAEAVELFREDGEAGLGEAITTDAVSLSLVRPTFAHDGALVMEGLFTTAACYACSDGKWSSYSRSVEIRLAEIPASLREFERTPAVLASFAATVREGSIRGWAVAPTSEAGLAELRIAMRVAN